MADLKAQKDECIKQIQELKQKIITLRGEIDPDVQPLAAAAKQQGLVPGSVDLKLRKTLNGHYGKVYSLNWCNDSRTLVSASQDGKLIIWNAFGGVKTHVITLPSVWVMTCAYAPGGELVASGGLDNVVTVHRIIKDAAVDAQLPYSQFNRHEGYISCIRFMSPDEMITSSGDSTCILWDITTQKPKAIFNDHRGDVMSVALNTSAGQFISGSCDMTAKLWDPRVNGRKAVKTFIGHESDINSVCWFPEGYSIAAGGDDGTARLFDIRAYRQIHKYYDMKNPAGCVTSVGFSGSGKYLFAGYDDARFRAYDTNVGDLIYSPVQACHYDRLSTMGISEDGKALATGSWDKTIKLWA